ncbi:MAG: acyl-[acyl-carrier-protein]--UDP-N-acetylglucosamine O-acyltransferase [Rickettsiales bacterium]|nr:MAG: acyl-[acyl-carrier-protein]--UDP-N-acetylglucosamine O-acyltransferase [Rickettsiales bacterium]
MIHKTAIIGENVKIGKNVKIGAYSVIGDGAVLGDNVELKSHVITEGRVTIGEGTVIYPFASLSYPQTLKYEGEDSEVIIGKNNTIREYVTIQHGTTEGGMATKVGDNCLFMVGVHIAHNCIVGNNVIFANYASLAGHVEIGDHVIIGGLSAVQQFCRIGAHAMIGGVSAVTRDLVPYGLASSERAHFQGLNLIGMNRRGFDKKQSLEASKIVKDIFNGSSGGVFNKRVEIAKESYPENKVLQEIIEFIQKDETRTYCKFK